MKTEYYIFYNNKGEPDFWKNIKYRTERKIQEIRYS